MKCPICGLSENEAVEKQIFPLSVRRRRLCASCGYSFVTYETAHAHPLIVVKSDGHRECFQYRKLRRSIETVCTKRPVSAEDIEAGCDVIRKQSLRTGNAEISSGVIYQAVAEWLMRLDDVAYKRYTAAGYSGLGFPLRSVRNRTRSTGQISLFNKAN